MKIYLQVLRLLIKFIFIYFYFIYKQFNERFDLNVCGCNSKKSLKD